MMDAPILAEFQQEECLQLDEDWYVLSTHHAPMKKTSSSSTTPTSSKKY